MIICELNCEAASDNVFGQNITIKTVTIRFLSEVINEDVRELYQLPSKRKIYINMNRSDIAELHYINTSTDFFNISGLDLILPIKNPGSLPYYDVVRTKYLTGWVDPSPFKKC